MNHIETVQRRAQEYLMRKELERQQRNETIFGTLAMLVVIVGVIAFLWVL